MINDFLPFCPVDSGTNLESQSAYAADANRTSGNQPGVASSKLNNKALRQATYVANSLAQLTANLTGTDVLDNATPAQFLAQLEAAIARLPVWAQGQGGTTSFTYYTPFYFFTAPATASQGDTYTNNGVTFTIATDASAGGATMLLAQPGGAAGPVLTGGTLTRTSGTGSATIAYYAVRKATALRVRMVGAGGGGGGGGTTATAGGSAGGSSTFGSYTAAGGAAATTTNGGLGGAVTGFGTLLAVSGGSGSSASTISAGGTTSNTSVGGSSVWGGSLTGRTGSTTQINPTVNNGSGGAGGQPNATGGVIGASGGGGGYFEVLIQGTLANSYTGTIGAGGTGGSAGSGGVAGGSGGPGIGIIEAYF